MYIGQIKTYIILASYKPYKALLENTKLTYTYFLFYCINKNV